MTRAATQILIALIPLVAWSGCAACRPGSSFVDSGFRASPALPEAVLPDADGPDLILDQPSSPPIAVHGGSVGLIGPGHAVTRQDSIALAAGASTLGNLLDAKARECCGPAASTKPSVGHHAASPGGQPADLRGEILRVAAIEARNRAAGGGVTLFHRLEQAVAQRQAAQESLEVVDEALTNRTQFEERGLTIPESMRGLQPRRLDLLASISQLDEAILRASVGLRQQLNAAPLNAITPLWPVDRIQVDDRPIAPEAEVELGLARRPEVALLHRLDAMQGAETIQSLQQILAGVNPLLGLDCESTPPAHASSLLALAARLKAQPEVSDRNLAATRRVWDAYRVERLRQIAGEIRMAAVEVRTTLDRARIARERVTICQTELDRVEARAGQDMATFAARVEARLALISARSALWEVVAAYLVAEARLHQDQFRLL